MRQIRREANSKRGRRSKRKGNDGERDVARKLEAWWSTVEEGSRFAKTPSSGGHGRAAEFAMCGDVMTTATRFPFVVEVKNRPTAWSLPALLAHGIDLGGKVAEWWKEAEEAAEKQGGSPMLWIKTPSRSWLVMIRKVKSIGIRFPVLDLGDHYVFAYEAFDQFDPELFAKKAA